MSRTSFIRSLQGFPRNASRQPIASIVRAVSRATGQDPAMVCNKLHRTRPIARARQEVMRRAALEEYTQSEIGAFFGLDHTSVGYGIKAATNRSN